VALKLGRKERRPKNEEGRMTLGEHIAELRNRLFKSVLAIVAGMVVGWIYYVPLLNILKKPFDDGVVALARQQGMEPQLTMTGVADPFTFQIKIALVFGLVLAGPIWLYQLWAFIVPGLHRNERKWTYLFAGIAAPLFFAGIAVGYWTLPKAIQLLLNFTPPGVDNLVALPGYLDFVLRMLLVFGVAFLIPLVVVLLNLAGVVKATALAKARPYIILGAWVFAAVATPTGDPFTLSFLAVPMCLLFIASEVIARIVDKRRTKREIEEYGEALS
jgi:sec-independent protein translocase protein TatC